MDDDAGTTLRDAIEGRMNDWSQSRPSAPTLEQMRKALEALRFTGKDPDDSDVEDGTDA